MTNYSNNNKKFLGNRGIQFSTQKSGEILRNKNVSPICNWGGRNQHKLSLKKPKRKDFVNYFTDTHVANEKHGKDTKGNNENSVSPNRTNRCVCQSLSHVRLLQPHGLQPTGLLHLWDFPGKNTGKGCHFLLHIEPMQG